MKLAFCIFKYFPFGGLQRDFLQIASGCAKAGFDIQVYTYEWIGDKPENFTIKILPKRSWSNHCKAKNFVKDVKKELEKNSVDAVIGFNKMPYLDIYYAADSCYIERVKNKGLLFYNFTGRYKIYSAFENAVFSKNSHTEILMISEKQNDIFIKEYNTQPNRLHLLPPGINRNRCKPPDYKKIRNKFRKEFDVDDKFVLLQIGSGFRTKGVDRSIRALASLPPKYKSNIKLFVVGKGKPEKYMRLAKKNKVTQNIQFFSGRDDIPYFLFGCDLLIHPALNENTGTALLESVVAGLPVLCSGICGYSVHIEKANAGKIVPEPFKQANLNKYLSEMILDKKSMQNYKKNALQYAKETDLYTLYEKAASLITKIVLEKHNRG